MSGRAGYHLGRAIGEMTNHKFASKPAKRISKAGNILGIFLQAGGALVMIWASDSGVGLLGLLAAVTGVVLQLLLHWIAVQIEHTSPLPRQGRYPLRTLFYGLDSRPLGAVREDDYFDASVREVRKLAHLSEGGQCVRGYSIIKIPYSVQTVKELYSFLTFHGRANYAGVPSSLRLYWTQHKEELVFRQERITIGRQSDNTLTFDGTSWNKYLSRHHAEFFRKDGQWYLQDMKSVNHTFVNRKQLQPHTPVLLQQGDIIQFASADTFLFDPSQT